MKQQKDRSRAATAIDTTDWVVLIENPLVEFVGYEMLETQTRIAKYRKDKRKGPGVLADCAGGDTLLCRERRPGGRYRRIACPKGESIRVIDTKKENDLIIQFTDELPSDPGAPVIARVDGAQAETDGGTSLRDAPAACGVTEDPGGPCRTERLAGR